MSKGTRLALIIGGVVLALLITIPTVWGWIAGWGGYSGWSMMGGPGMMGGGFGSMFLMPVVGIVVLGLIVWALVAGIRGAGWYSGPTPAGQPDTALEVLKKRYARGEINKQEFEDKKKDLV